MNQYNSKRFFKYEHPKAQININRFEHLRNNMECYKCQNFGHIAKDYRLENPPEESSKPQNEQTWKKKKTDNCALALKAQKNKDVWYVDSSFSTHMTGDRRKFVSLKEKKDGTIFFGNDGSSNVIGSGTVTLGSKDVIAKNVLLVENMNQNLLSVGQMCDQGHTMLFNSTKCEIMKCRYGKIVATTSRAPNDIYVLDEATKACLLAKEDES